MGISLRAYARHRKARGLSGGTDKAVRVAAQAGRITLLPDGTVDPVLADAQWAASTDQAKVRSPEACRPGAVQAGQLSPGRDIKPIPGSARRAVLEATAAGAIPEIGGNGAVTYAKARAANEAIKAQMNKLRLERQRGELVNRRAVAAHVFELARKERDSWLQLPARKAALYAAELGVDAHAMERHLDRLIRDHLAELAEIKVDIRPEGPS